MHDDIGENLETMTFWQSTFNLMSNLQVHFSD